MPKRNFWAGLSRIAAAASALTRRRKTNGSNATDAYWRLWKMACGLGFEAQAVIAMRLARINAGGAKADAECRRMVREKFAAAAAAQAAAVAALAGGETLDAAATRALAPVQRTVHANHRRLLRAKRFDNTMLGVRRLLSRGSR